jgi:hypothetical protein
MFVKNGKIMYQHEKSISKELLGRTNEGREEIQLRF